MKSSPGDRNALLIHDELGEVPLDGVDEGPTLLALQVGEQRVLGAAVHVDLREEIEFRA